MVSPKYFPYVGKGIARLSKATPEIDIVRFDIPKDAGSAFTLLVKDAKNGSYVLKDQDGRELLGALAKASDRMAIA